MGAFYRSGSVQIEQGAIDFAVDGLALPFAPSSVSVSVRLPDAESDIITAFVVGTPTYDGFSVGLSSPAPSEGYVLDWCASSVETAVEPEESTLAVSYDGLFSAVRRFLGYGETVTDAQREEIDSCIQSGVRQFYYPPKVDGADENHEWSFLRIAGSIQLSAGVSSYTLPDGFARLAGMMYYSPEDHLPPVVQTSEQTIRSRLSRDCRRGFPKACAILWKSAFGQRGQRREAVFWPVPERSVVLYYSADADTGRLDPSERNFPLGGSVFSELVIESCLAIAEQRSNDEAGLHTQNFNRLLVSAIAKDRKSSAARYGDMSFSQDPGAFALYAGRNVVHGLRITYNGQEL